MVFYSCSAPSSEVETPIIEIPIKERTITISEITNLNEQIKETSGLINLNNLIITHNDSGDEPNLYEVNTENGNVLRKVAILNAKNIDMEDIAQDDNFIYLCDVGNNSNSRNDQTIYKIKKSEYLIQDEVRAEIITIGFQEQSDFSKSRYTTNFDAEAVIAMGDSLFLFTKNWGDLKTSVYAIPKEVGDYEVSKITTADVKGLITGADFDKYKNRIVLTGYSSFKPFIIFLTNFSKNNPLDGKIDKIDLNLTGSNQIEGVSTNPDGSYYISAEGSLGLPAVLYLMTVN